MSPPHLAHAASQRRAARGVVVRTGQHRSMLVAVTHICRVSGTHMKGHSALPPAPFPSERNSRRMFEDLKKKKTHNFQLCGVDGGCCAASGCFWCVIGCWGHGAPPRSLVARSSASSWRLRSGLKKTASVVAKHSARMVTVVTSLSSASASSRESFCGAGEQCLGHGRLVALLLEDAPRFYLSFKRLGEGFHALCLRRRLFGRHFL